MSADTPEKIIKSPFPKFAAESRWNDEQRYGTREGQQRRLAEMSKAGIVSEVLDLIEALQMPSAEATKLLVTTHENAARSAEFLSGFWQQQGKPLLAEQDRLQAQKDRAHADILRKGEVTIEQELEARAKQREALGFPDNPYKTLLTNPVFLKKDDILVNN